MLRMIGSAICLMRVDCCSQGDIDDNHESDMSMDLVQGSVFVYCDVFIVSVPGWYGCLPIGESASSSRSFLGL